ncbi:MAG TPA: 30S ribosome-binding factor RbfA [Thermoanaerobaculia bacterium]|nr:30S ribosome-binding factor RbfA [Thermoanaerobaculia bacterium]
MKKTRRTIRVGEMLRDEIVQIMRRDLGDPGLQFVSITDVEVATDFRHARVFISSLGSAEDRDEAVRKLQSVAGRIRYLLGQRVRLRHVPQLQFRADLTAERAARIEELLGEVRQHDSGTGNEDEE